jgi:hypothetical protein
MWQPWRLTTLWASTACYMDSFTLFYLRDGMSILLLDSHIREVWSYGYQITVCEELPKAKLKKKFCNVFLLVVITSDGPWMCHYNVTINGELPVRHPVSLSMNHTIQMLAHNTAIFQWKMYTEISNSKFFFITIIRAPTWSTLFIISCRKEKHLNCKTFHLKPKCGSLHYFGFFLD